MKFGCRIIVAGALFLAPGAASAEGWEFRNIVNLFDPDPLGAAGLLVQLESPLLNEAGQVGFLGATSGGGAAAHVAQGGAISVRATAGSPAPGTAETFAGLTSLRLTGAGDVAVRGFLATDPPSADDRFTIHREIGGALELVARTTAPAPGVPGAALSALGDPAVNAAGATAYAAALSGGGATVADNLGLFRREPDGTTTLIARRGDVLAEGPGEPGELRPFETGPLTFGTFTDVHMTADGGVIFKSIVSDDSGSGMAAFRIDPDGTVTRLARGRDALDGGLEFIGIDRLAANASGEIAFTAFAAGAPGGEAVIRGTTGAYEVVARNLDAAPDTPDFSFRDFIGISLNDDGRAAMLARLWDGPFGSITGEAPTSLFAELDGGLRRVLSVGDVLEIAPGEFRTVSVLTVASSFDALVTSQPFFNTAGQVAFRAFYEGGGGGIFVASPRAAEAPPVIPAPPALAALLLGLGTLAAVRGRRQAEARRRASDRQRSEQKRT